MKVIASPDDVDFTPLVSAPPQTGTKNLPRDRGGENPLYALMRDALHGTRAVVRESAAPGEWTTAEITFDVVPATKSSR